MYGKILLCKTFILSQVNYLIQSLSPPEEVLADIDRLMFKFIWQKRTSNKKVIERISRNFLCQDIQLGGLKMISVKDQQKVFHINWIKKINQEGNIFGQLVDTLTKKVGGINYIIKCLSLENPQPIMDNLIESNFWKRVIDTWCKIGYDSSTISTSPEDLLHKPLFFNKEIKYHNNSLYFPQWIKQNILYIHDLFQNFTFLEYKELSQVIKKYPGFIFDYNALINAIPKNWKIMLNNIAPETIQKAKSLKYCMTKLENNILKLNNNDLRKLLLSHKNITRCNEKFWKRKFDVDILKHYMSAYKATKESKLRLLHFKLMHNIYPTNILLYKMKVRPNILCNNCQVPDFLEHFFVECQLICDFWKHVSSHIRSVMNLGLKLSTKDILLGLEYSEHNDLRKKDINYINYVILLGKLCVSKFKYGEYKSIYLIFESELNLRQKHLKYNQI